MRIIPQKIIYNITNDTTCFIYLDGKDDEHFVEIQGKYQGKLTAYEVTRFIEMLLKKEKEPSACIGCLNNIDKCDCDHPQTADTTTEEAKELLFNGSKKRDKLRLR